MLAVCNKPHTDETGFYITCPSDTPLPDGQIPNTPFNFKIPMMSTKKRMKEKQSMQCILFHSDLLHS